MIDRHSPRHRHTLLFFLLLVSLSTSDIRAREDSGGPRKASAFPTAHFERGPYKFDIENSGAFFTAQNNGLTLTDFPLITGAGLMIAGKELSTGAIHSSMGGPYLDRDNQPGVINGVYAGDQSVAADPTDPRFHIYTISRADASGGTNSDYAQWPVQFGAPVGSDGKPLILGDRQLFYVYNDLSLSTRPIGGLPMGIEVRVLGWWDDSDPFLADAWFFRFRILNKSGFTYDSVYAGIWSDPDLGWSYHRNEVGCDTTLRLFYAYSDAEFDPASYGISIPAAGFLFLAVEEPRGSAGPEEFTFVPIERSGLAPYFPDTGPGSQNYVPRMFNYLRGRTYQGYPIVNGITGQVSTHPLNGDPVTDRGWMPRNSNLSPTDFRMMGSNGPFQLGPGDSLTLTVALIVSRGQDRLGSLSLMRFNAEQILSAFKSPELPFVYANPSWSMEYTPGSSPRAHLAAKVRGISSCTAELTGGGGTPLFSSTMTGSDTLTTTIDLPPAQRPASGDLVALTSDGRTMRFRGAFSRLSAAPPPQMTHGRIILDQTNGDSTANPGEWIEYTANLLNPSPWSIDSLTLELTAGNQPVNAFTIFARSYTPGQESPLEAPLTFMIDSSAGKTGVDLLPYTIRDHTSFNLWRDTLRMRVEPFRYSPKEVYPDHLAGTATKSPSVSLVDPTAWKDHQYAITFPFPAVITVVDRWSGDTLVQNMTFDSYYASIPSVTDVQRRVIDGFKILPGTMGDNSPELREYLGPGGIPLESEPHELSVRLGRSLKRGRPNSTNTFSIESRSYIDAGLTFEVRATTLGSRYYIATTYNGVPGLAPGRVPFEIWRITGNIDHPTDTRRLAIVLFDADSNGVISPKEGILGVGNVPYAESPIDELTLTADYSGVNFAFARTPEGRFVMPDAGTVIRMFQPIAPGQDDVYVIRPVQASQPVPNTLVLRNNFPNPFNPGTTISFNLPVKTRVRVSVYDILGAEVAVLLDDERDAGVQYAFWEGRSKTGTRVASGVYLYRVVTPVQSATGKMLLIR